MNNNDIYFILNKYVGNCLKEVGVKIGEGYCVGRGIEDIKKLEEMERKINLSFSSEYKKFLKNYGEVCIEGFDIYGSGSPSIHGNNCTVIDKTKFYKEEQKWPGIEDWYIISDDGSGNPIGIDPDGVVWLSDHDAGFEKVKLADNFEEFLYKILTDTLYE